ncbi:glycosyltransferase [Bdellovibrio sp. HCB2-146]|uniref:glycosyltransferase n=1 Tax=Bdellovibrio sp. HCB2-146 TaxID=3394362 RepID=UPI0039BD8F75
MKSYYLLQYHDDQAICQRRLLKAERSGASHLLMTWDWYQADCELNFPNVKTALLLPHSVLRTCSNESVESILQRFDEIVLEFDPNVKSLSGHLERLFQVQDRIQALFRFRQNFDISNCLSYFPIWLREKLCFSPSSELSGKQIYIIGQEIEKRFPEIKYKPLPGLVQWDERIPAEVELVLEGKASLEMRSSAPDIQISVVIPCFEAGDFLLNSIRHLLRQTLNRDSYEILLIDDGSSQPVLDELQNFLAPEMGHLNFRYYHLPKTVSAESMLGQFRAGLCRNFGASEANGAILSFLDSDMLVPTGYLKRVMQRLAHTEILQFVRYHIKPSLSHQFTNLRDLKKSDYYIEESSYWGPFFASDDWMQIPDYWKYTCTYSLSLRRQHFYELGQFRKTYVSYGFEDTDLGYTAYLKKYRFYLEKEPLFHLTPFSEKARYRHSMYFKHQLMKTTAKTFFMNHLSPTIYEKLKVFLQ